MKRFAKDSDGIHRVEFESVAEVVETAVIRGGGNHPVNAQRLDDRLDDMASAERQRYFNHYDRDKLLAAIANPPEDLVLAVERIKESLEAKVLIPVGRRRRTVRRSISVCLAALRNGRVWRLIARTRTTIRGVPTCTRSSARPTCG